MKKILHFILTALFTALLLVSCNPNANGEGDNPSGGGGSTGGSTTTGSISGAEGSSASEFEISIAKEVNLFRSNPQNYVATYITDQDDWYTNQQKAKFNTHEGYQSLVNDVKGKTSDLGQLIWLEGIYKCAKKHCNELLEANKMQHDRLTPPTSLSVLNVVDNKIVDSGAMGVFCEVDPNARSATAGENLSGSMNTARFIVIQLLLDDNVPSRGHRGNIMNTNFKQIGTAFGEKTGYTAGGTLNPTLCVMDFGAGYVNKSN